MVHIVHIKRLACQFRNAIEQAKDEGDFSGISPFNCFPVGCCGDTSDLLAHFLLENGIRTRYVQGTYRDGGFEYLQSHAWLVTGKNIIIDITGDQFKHDKVFLNYDVPVYVGSMDKFHRLFEVESRDIKVHGGIRSLGSGCHRRLFDLYDIIMEYI